MLTQKKAVKNTIWIIIGNLYTSILSFVLNIFTANYLGPSDIGMIGYIASFISFSLSVGSLGINSIIVKEILHNPLKEDEVVGTSFVLQFLSLLTSYGVTVLIIYQLNINNNILLVSSVLQGLMIVLKISDVFSYYFQAKLKSKYGAIISMVGYTIMQTYKIVILVTNKSVEWFAAARSIDCLLILILFIVVYKMKKGPKFRFSKSMAKRLLKQSIPYMIIGSIGILYGSIDRMMLKRLLEGTYEVGIYEQAFVLSHFWSFVTTAIVVSFGALVYEAAKEGVESEKYKLRIRQLYCFLFWTIFTIAFCVSIISPFIIKWFYNEKFHAAIVPTIILTWGAVFAFMGSGMQVQLLSEGKQKYGIVFSISALLVNALINYLLIPKYTTTGASIATLLSEFFVCFIAPLMFKKTRNLVYTMVLGICFQKVNIKEIISIIKEKIFKIKKEEK